MFLKERAKQEEMYGFLTEQNMKEYAIRVHGLKGNARTLGADALADAAFEHEKQSKAGNAEYVSAHWNELLCVWDKTAGTVPAGTVPHKMLDSIRITE